jgi:hypothetical protein
MDVGKLKDLFDENLKFIIKSQNENGSFDRDDQNFEDPWTTAECILALMLNKSTKQVEKSINWLIDQQHENGSWSSASYKDKSLYGDVAATSYVIKALSLYGADEKNITKAYNWLLRSQNSDGGWGISNDKNRRSHIGLTAYALSALAYLCAEHESAEAIQDGLHYLYKEQTPTSCWAFSPTSDDDLTLSSYVIRSFIDLEVLKGIKFDKSIINNWYNLFSEKQNLEGSWSDWLGNRTSIESACYFIEISFSSGIIDVNSFDRNSTVIKTLLFLENQYLKKKGWYYGSIKKPSLWLTHNVLIALSHIIGIRTKISLKLPNNFRRMDTNQYDFAISFAGEDRVYAKQLALSLKSNGSTVFFDEFETTELWGANLIEELTNIYKERAKFCIMIISDHYLQKIWTNLERKSALTRAVRDESAYILPIMLGDKNVFPKGLLESTGYLSADQYSINEISNMAILKLESK